MGIFTGTKYYFFLILTKIFYVKCYKYVLERKNFQHYNMGNKPILKQYNSYSSIVEKDLHILKKEMIYSRFSKIENNLKNSKNNILWITYVNNFPVAIIWTKLSGDHISIYEAEVFVEYRKKGYFTTSLKEICKRFFRKDIEYIEADVNVLNSISQYAFRKLDFRERKVVKFHKLGSFFKWNM